MTSVESLDPLLEMLATLEAKGVSLAQAYHQALIDHLPGYILAEVRGICTERSPGHFLQLGEAAQKRLIHLTQQLTQSLCQELRHHLCTGSLDQLGNLVEPYLQASERQLNQLLALEQLGPVTLKLFAAELGSPTLRSLRAQWQVNQSRQAAIRRQIAQLREKNQVVAAQARWDELVTSG